MGSSKKHKEKDREHKHKRKHRSRDRSRSKERKHRDKSSRGNKSEGSKRAKYDPAYAAQQDGANMAYNIRVDAAPAINAGLEAGRDEANEGKSNLSLSIEETNKLRAKLGLKPLDGSSTSKDESVKKEEDEDVHAPPINIGQVKRTEELREKVHQLKEKRRLQSRMGKMKPLSAAAADEDDAESAMAWVMKSRKLEEDRMMADQRAKMLEEMDNEFGIGNLVEAEFGQKRGGYGAKDLKGLRVEHSQETFAEGKTVILTLKDKRILDEDDEGDTLINVNMIDDEHAAKNVENKKRKPDYRPYDEPEYDEYGMMKPKEILDKYDEEIQGQKKESFEIGGGGRYNAEHERFMKQMIADIRQQKQELTLPPPMLASEFFSPEEMAAFKKPKKKKDRGLRKKMKLTADDLLATIKEEPAELRIQDDVMMDGSAGPSGVRIKTEVPESIPGLDLTVINIDGDGDFDDGSAEGPDDDLSGVLFEEDKAAIELELALKRARKVKVEKKIHPPEKPENDEGDEKMDDLPAASSSSSGIVIADSGASVVMNSTSEFCRALGEIPTYGLAGNREENDDEMMDYDRDADPRNRNDREDDEFATGWQSVEIDTRPIDINSDDKAVLDDEPVVNQGLAGALQLADKKGYLERQFNKGTGAPRNTQLEAQNYSIEDKRYDDLDEKYRKQDRYSGGMTMEFKEKEGYKPDIKLDYVDDAGRKISEKEAFRILSHRFHGKGSGKKKTEKRIKKVEEEQMMSSTDTPLNTVHLLQERQKANKMPYVILSGGKGIAALATMSDLNATFHVDEPVFEWKKKTTAKSPTKSQKQFKNCTAALKNFATPCRAQCVPVNTVPEKAKGFTVPKVMGSPGRVPVTQASATPCRYRNSVQHTICGTPSTANKNLAAVSVTPAGPSRIPVTEATPYRHPISMRYAIYAGNVNQNTVGISSVGPGRVPITRATAMPYHDPNLLRRTIYATPSGNKKRNAMSVTSARRTLPPPQRVPVSEAKPGKLLTKSRADKVQKLLDFEEEDSKQ